MGITTLIPAFKVAFLPSLIAALERQTVRPVRVLLSDDSPDGDFLRVLATEPWAARCEALKLEVARGPCRGAHANVTRLIDWWGGSSERVHLLFDDDLVFPTFYERHLAAIAQLPECRASVSLRWRSAEDGVPQVPANAPAAVLQHPARLLALPADVLFASTLGAPTNWLGEFSNTVLHADLVPGVSRPRLFDMPATGLEDLGTFLNASLAAPLALVNEHLGCFRSSPQQHSAQPLGTMMKLSACAWVPLAIESHRHGRLDDAQRDRCVQLMSRFVLARYAELPELAPLCAALRARLANAPGADDAVLDAWLRYVVATVPHAVADALKARAEAVAA